MRASRTIKPLGTTLVAKIVLCVCIAFTLVTFEFTPSYALAAETSASATSDETEEVTPSSGATIAEQEVPLASLEFTTSLPSFDRRSKNLSSSDEVSPGVVQPSSDGEQAEYISVPGYSAFNHFSVALEATVAASAVILVGVVVFLLCRRHMGNQEKISVKSNVRK